MVFISRAEGEIAVVNLGSCLSIFLSSLMATLTLRIDEIAVSSVWSQCESRTCQGQS